MLWGICALSSCVCGGVGVESVSFYDESFGNFSKIEYHVRNVTLGVVVFCGGV